MNSQTWKVQIGELFSATRLVKLYGATEEGMLGFRVWWGGCEERSRGGTWCGRDCCKNETGSTTRTPKKAVAVKNSALKSL